MAETDDRKDRPRVNDKGAAQAAQRPAVAGGARVSDDSEQELKTLREMNELKTRFMSMAAHELNTPLTPIKIQLHVLRTNHQGFANSPEAARGLDLLDRNVQRLSRLVQDVLDATRLQSGHLPLRPANVSLNAIVAETVEGFQDAARQAGVELTFRPTTETEIKADPDRIAQLCSNLVANAIKFTPHGGRVEVSVQQEGDRLTLSIVDTGVGIRPDDVPRLAQPFTQLQTPINETRGTGLGLYICKGIAEEHGGRLSIDSKGIGRGTTVRVDLPRNLAGTSSKERDLSSPPPDTLEQRVRRIL